MRRPWRRVLAPAGIIVGLLAAALGVALFNLNAIIRANRADLVAMASRYLGRPVSVGAVRVRLGMTLRVVVEDVAIADDARFSTGPFVAVPAAYVGVDFLPLLIGRLRLTRVSLVRPRLLLVRGVSGELNVESLGRQAGSSDAAGPYFTPGLRAAALVETVAQPSQPPNLAETGGTGGAVELALARLDLEDGTVVYTDRRAKSPPLSAERIALRAWNIAPDRPFSLELGAALSERNGLMTATGTAGPLFDRNGKPSLAKLPLKLKLTIDSLDLAKAAAASRALGRELPSGWSASGFAGLNAELSGTPAKLLIGATLDLTKSFLAYASVFQKKAGLPLNAELGGAVLQNATLKADRLRLVLGGQGLALTDLSFSRAGLAARLRPQTIALSPLETFFPSTRAHAISGSVTASGSFDSTGPADLSTQARIRLNDVRANLPAFGGEGISHLNGAILLFGGQAATDGPITFALGREPAEFKARATSFEPLSARWELSANRLKPSQAGLAGWPAEDELSLLWAGGALRSVASGPALEWNATSVRGVLAKLPYQDLRLAGRMESGVLTISSMSARLLSGRLQGRGAAVLDPVRRFELALQCRDIALGSLVAALKPSDAGRVGGILAARLDLRASGRTPAQIEESLAGGGRAVVKGARLAGTNVVAAALRRVRDLPALDALIPASIVRRHPELFEAADTDLGSVSADFSVAHRVIDANNVQVKSKEYSVAAGARIGFDQRLSGAGRVFLSPGLSREIASARPAASLLVDSRGSLEVPLKVRGTLSKVSVEPDLGVVANEVGNRAGRQMLRQIAPDFLRRRLENLF